MIGCISDMLLQFLGPLGYNGSLFISDKLAKVLTTKCRSSVIFILGDPLGLGHLLEELLVLLDGVVVVVPDSNMTVPSRLLVGHCHLE